MNNFTYIKSVDFECTGMVTASCNLNKLCISIDDAFTFDVEPLLCTGFVTDILAKWDEIINLDGAEVPENLQKWYSLIFGDHYNNCNGKIQRHLGIKRMWIYYAYANYILLNPFDDTPNGLKYKTNEFSMPVPIKDLNGLSTSFKNKAIEAYKNIKEYLCLNKDYFTTFDACDCHLSCGCVGTCSCGSTKRVGVGFRYRSVKKK
jgi:hypothetical protein